MYDKEFIAKLRQKYIDNPPDGMTPSLVREMSDSNLLDMDEFLHEDVFDEDDFEDGFHIF